MDSGSAASLLSEGVNLMLLGMGTVFVFLTVLVFVTTLMSTLVNKYVPETISPKSSSPSAQAPPEDKTLLVAISAAIHAHRSK